MGQQVACAGALGNFNALEAVMRQARSAIPSSGYVALLEYRSVVYFHAAEFASIDKYKDELLYHEAEATSPWENLYGRVMRLPITGVNSSWK
jgi:hypothetical protein